MHLNRKNIMVIAMGLGLALFAGLYYFSLAPASNNLESLNISYSQSFKNFDIGTKIEITYKNEETKSLTSKKIVINSDNQNIDLGSKISEMTYQIVHDNNYTDIEFTKNKILFSGLQKNHKVQITQNNHTLTNEIPVDWAGRLTLDAPAPNHNQCFSIIDSTRQSICHQTTQQVAS
jgi:hypothetical protein